MNFLQNHSELLVVQHCLENSVKIPEHIIKNLSISKTQLISLEGGNKDSLWDSFILNWKLASKSNISKLEKLHSDFKDLFDFINEVKIDDKKSLNNFHVSVFPILNLNFDTPGIIKTIELCDVKLTIQNLLDIFYLDVNTSEKIEEDEDKNDGDKFDILTKKHLTDFYNILKNSTPIDSKSFLRGMDKLRREFDESIYLLTEDIDDVKIISFSNEEICYITPMGYDDFSEMSNDIIYISPDFSSVYDKMPIVELSVNDINKIKNILLTVIKNLINTVKNLLIEYKTIVNNSDIKDAILNKKNSSKLTSILNGSIMEPYKYSYRYLEVLSKELF